MTSLGNTFFLNAISQCLLVTESLTSLAPPPMVNALTKLKSTDNQTIRPKELVRAISQLNPSMASGQQQDAAEALELLLASDVVQGPQSDPSRGEIADVISYRVWHAASDRWWSGHLIHRFSGSADTRLVPHRPAHTTVNQWQEMWPLPYRRE